MQVTHERHADEPRPAAADHAVYAHGVSKRFAGQAAVAGLDLAIPAGTIFGLIGPSGSGKTTTVRLLTGVHAQDEGTIAVLGQPPAAFTPAERARIGYLPQLPVLFPTLSLLGNLSFVASIYGMPLRRKERFREVLEFVELWDDRRKLLRNASGGMQRRLALAAALVHEPSVLFLDEPTAGIDPVLRRKFWDRFAHLRDEGATLIVTTQYVGEAAYCDVVGLLDGGRLVACDTPEALREMAYGGDLVEVVASDPLSAATLDELAALPFVRRWEAVAEDARACRLVVDEADEAMPRISGWFSERGLGLQSLREDEPSFDDVFVALVQGAQTQDGDR